MFEHFLTHLDLLAFQTKVLGKYDNLEGLKETQTLQLFFQRLLIPIRLRFLTWPRFYFKSTCSFPCS